MAEHVQRQNWSPLVHSVYRIIRENPQIPQGEWVVGWSGGADSTALLHCLSLLAQPLGLKLHAVTVHHGPGPWKSMRDQMEEFCSQRASHFQCTWQSIRSNQELKSEAELRKFRRATLREVMKARGSSLIVMGHHLDDLVETRLLRLFRGTGLVGLKSMQNWKPPILRPFLQITKAQLLNELRSNNQKWFDDASNVDNGPQRNWLRNEILPQIRHRDPKILENLSRSLELMVATFQAEPPVQWKFDGAISLAQYLALSSVQRERIVYSYLQTLGVPDVRHSQIKEVCRQLDKARRVDTFKVAGCEWKVNAGQVEARVLKRAFVR